MTRRSSGRLDHGEVLAFAGGIEGGGSASRAVVSGKQDGVGIAAEAGHGVVAWLWRRMGVRRPA